MLLHPQMMFHLDGPKQLELTAYDSRFPLLCCGFSSLVFAPAMSFLNVPPLPREDVRLQRGLGCLGQGLRNEHAGGKQGQDPAGDGCGAQASSGTSRERTGEQGITVHYLLIDVSHVPLITRILRMTLALSSSCCFFQPLGT